MARILKVNGKAYHNQKVNFWKGRMDYWTNRMNTTDDDDDVELSAENLRTSRRLMRKHELLAAKAGRKRAAWNGTIY